LTNKQALLRRRILHYYSGRHCKSRRRRRPWSRSGGKEGPQEAFSEGGETLDHRPTLSETFLLWTSNLAVVAIAIVIFACSDPILWRPVSEGHTGRYQMKRKIAHYSPYLTSVLLPRRLQIEDDGAFQIFSALARRSKVSISGFSTDRHHPYPASAAIPFLHSSKP